MRLLKAKLTNGNDHWINPVIYDGLEFSNDPDTNIGRVFCHYRELAGGVRTHISYEATNIAEMVDDYGMMMRGE